MILFILININGKWLLIFSFFILSKYNWEHFEFPKFYNFYIWTFHLAFCTFCPSATLPTIRNHSSVRLAVAANTSNIKSANERSFNKKRKAKIRAKSLKLKEKGTSCVCVCIVRKKRRPSTNYPSENEKKRCIFVQQCCVFCGTAGPAVQGENNWCVCVCVWKITPRTNWFRLRRENYIHKRHPHTVCRCRVR